MPSGSLMTEVVVTSKEKIVGLAVGYFYVQVHVQGAVGGLGHLRAHAALHMELQLLGGGGVDVGVETGHLEVQQLVFFFVQM
jgi:hypothetical protein